MVALRFVVFFIYEFQQTVEREEDIKIKDDVLTSLKAARQELCIIWSSAMPNDGTAIEQSATSLSQLLKDHNCRVEDSEIDNYTRVIERAVNPDWYECKRSLLVFLKFVSCHAGLEELKDHVPIGTLLKTILNEHMNQDITASNVEETMLELCTIAVILRQLGLHKHPGQLQTKLFHLCQRIVSESIGLALLESDGLAGTLLNMLTAVVGLGCQNLPWSYFLTALTMNSKKSIDEARERSVISARHVWHKIFLSRNTELFEATKSCIAATMDIRVSLLKAVEMEASESVKLILDMWRFLGKGAVEVDMDLLAVLAKSACYSRIATAVLDHNIPEDGVCATDVPAYSIILVTMVQMAAKLSEIPGRRYFHHMKSILNRVDTVVGGPNCTPGAWRWIYRYSLQILSVGLGEQDLSTAAGAVGW